MGGGARQCGGPAFRRPRKTKSIGLHSTAQADPFWDVEVRRFCRISNKLHLGPRVWSSWQGRV